MKKDFSLNTVFFLNCDGDEGEKEMKNVRLSAQMHPEILLGRGARSRAVETFFNFTISKYNIYKLWYECKVISIHFKMKFR